MASSADPGTEHKSYLETKNPSVAPLTFNYNKSLFFILSVLLFIYEFTFSNSCNICFRIMVFKPV